MVIREQREDGAYASLQHSLDSVHSRLAGAHDPELARAARVLRRDAQGAREQATLLAYRRSRPRSARASRPERAPHSGRLTVSLGGAERVA